VYDLQHLVDFLGLRDLAVFQRKDELVAELVLDVCERSIEPALARQFSIIATIFPRTASNLSPPGFNPTALTGKMSVHLPRLSQKVEKELLCIQGS
jgi:hypothetical protein